MNIEVRIIQPEQARYKTCGDYFVEDGVLIFQIVEQKTDFATKVILVHELVEQLLTEHKGIPEKEISDFDKRFSGEMPDGEPGDSPKAPYYDEHQLATIVERMICLQAGINFEKYNDEIIY